MNEATRMNKRVTSTKDASVPPGKTRHKWLGSKPNPWDDAKFFVLCWRVTGKIPADFENSKEGYVTLSNAHVTCQECSELIHA